MTKPILFILTLIFIFNSPTLLNAQEGIFSRITSELFEEENRVILHNKWKFQAGDDTSWAKPRFDDSKWETRSSWIPIGEVPEDWNGIGWFRIHVSVDSTLLNEPFMLSILPLGSVELYFNGNHLIENAADAMSSIDDYEGSELDAAAISFSESKGYVIAVKYTNSRVDSYHDAGFSTGFQLILNRPDDFINRSVRYIKLNLSYQMFFTALPLAFGILHFILFLFSPANKSNLYYSLYLILFAVNTFFDYQNFLSSEWSWDFFYLKIHRAILPFVNILLLRFIYSLFREKLPKVFWFISAGLIITGTVAFYKPVENFHYFVIFTLIAVIEIARVIILAIREKLDGAWIIAIGFMSMIIFSSYDILLDLELMSPINGMHNAYMFGLIGLFVCMSIYLSRDFAKRNEIILEQERQSKEEEANRKILEADNQRKTQELEQARKLQLSMLPDCLPEYRGLDICFEMKTATEVGGDYYDYHLADDGTLTIVIGDATGHGMKAGNMVVSIKSLFNALPHNMSIPDFFNKCTSIIKNMNMKQLYMSMTMVRIKDNILTVSAAGMPPVLIYRAKINSIEEILIKGMPLGHVEFPYVVKQTKLNSGDVVLLMTDGYTELFNKDKLMLGNARIKEYLIESSGKSPNEITGVLFEKGKIWQGTTSQEDDITFVVFKIN